MRWIHPQDKCVDASLGAKKWTRPQCLKEDTFPVEDSSKEGAEGQGKETCAKLSVIRVIKKDILVATAPSIPGIRPTTTKIGCHAPVRDKMW